MSSNSIKEQGQEENEIKRGRRRRTVTSWESRPKIFSLKKMFCLRERSQSKKLREEWECLQILRERHIGIGKLVSVQHS